MMHQMARTDYSYRVAEARRNRDKRSWKTPHESSIITPVEEKTWENVTGCAIISDKEGGRYLIH